MVSMAPMHGHTPCWRVGSALVHSARAWSAHPRPSGRSLGWWAVWAGALTQATLWLSTSGGVSASGWGGLLFGMLVSVLWGHEVLLRIGHVATCHVVASWYFDPSVGSVGWPCCRPVSRVGLRRACTNYLGSIALGALLIATLDALCWCACSVRRALGVRRAGLLGGVLRLAASCVACALGCVRNTAEWLTEWAYCHVALYGTSLFEAGSAIVQRLRASGAHAVIQSAILAPVLWVGRLLGAATGVGAGFAALAALEAPAVRPHHRWMPPLVGGIVGLATTSVALTCVDAATKALLLCYLDAPELMEAREPAVKAALHASHNDDMDEYLRTRAATRNSRNAPSVAPSAEGHPKAVHIVGATPKQATLPGARPSVIRM